MQPGKRAAKASGFEMFCYATSYWKAAALLGRAKNIVPYIIPWHVLEVLALEVYLKCLRRVRGKAPLARHPIHDLFNDLSQADRRAISKYFKRIIAHEVYGIAGPMNLKSVIDRASDMFTIVRYGYEGAPWPTDVRGQKGNVGVSQAIMALREVIAEKHPDWPAKCRAVLGVPTELDPHPYVIEGQYDPTDNDGAFWYKIKD